MENAEQKLFKLSGIVSTNWHAYIAGTSCYAYFFHIPSETSEINNQLRKWKEIFTATHQKVYRCMTTFGVISDVLVCVTSRGRLSRRLSLASVVSHLAVWLIIEIFDRRDRQQLQERDIVRREGEAWVRKKLNKQKWIHFVRMLFTILSFNLMLVALWNYKSDSFWDKANRFMATYLGIKSLS